MVALFIDLQGNPLYVLAMVSIFTNKYPPRRSMATGDHDKAALIIIGVSRSGKTPVHLHRYPVLSRDARRCA